MMDMITRKSFSIALILLLVLNLFVMDSSISDQRCKCTNNSDGQGFNAKAVSISHGCCSRTQVIPCNLQRDQIQDMPKSFISVLRLERHKPANIIVALTSDIIENHKSKSYSAQHIGRAIAISAPIYLQNFPLLC